MAITKLEAAQRQLDCAIRLFFGQDDLLSTHTLSRAAFRILYDLYPNSSSDGFEKDLGGIIQRIGWKQFNKVANFLKHADTDPDGEIDAHILDVQMGIGFGVILYHRLTDTYTPEMRAYDTFMQFVAPDAFAGPEEPEAEGYAEFMEMASRFKTMTVDEKMKLGRDIVEFFSLHPEGGNFYWPPPT